MLDKCKHTRRHEPGGADCFTTAGHFGDLDHCATLRDLDPTPGLGCHDVVGARAVTRVDDNLDSVASHDETLLACTLRDLEAAVMVGPLDLSQDHLGVDHLKRKTPRPASGLGRGDPVVPVEVPGIEPGSFDDSPGLLRAQPASPLLGSGDHAGKFTVTSPVA
jgi:hypothetical protein